MCSRQQRGASLAPGALAQSVANLWPNTKLCRHRDGPLGSLAKKKKKKKMQPQIVGETGFRDLVQQVSKQRNNNAVEGREENILILEQPGKPIDKVKIIRKFSETILYKNIKNQTFPV